MEIKENKLNPIITVLLALMLIFFVIPIIHFAEAVRQENLTHKSVTSVNTNEFGIVPDLLVASENQYAEGDNYYHIFREMGLPKSLTSKILYEGKEFLRGFTDGDIYHTYANAFNPDELIYLVLEKDPVNYVIVELRDTIKVYEGQRELTVRRKVIDGLIKTSFYHSLRGNDLHPDVISRLSEIYQWQIDFHRLKKGDNFKFVIEEKYAGDSLVGTPKIAGAYFNHNKEDYYAIYYNNPDLHRLL
jgi:murein DD-endopeptidase